METPTEGTPVAATVQCFLLVPGSARRSVNVPAAFTVQQLVDALSSQPEYAGQTFTRLYNGLPIGDADGHANGTSVIAANAIVTFVPKVVGGN